MSDIRFQPSWFNPANFEKYLLPLNDRLLECVDIGTFRGESAIWIADNLPNAFVRTIDPCVPYPIPDHPEIGYHLENVIRENLSPYLGRVKFFRMTSAEFFDLYLGEGIGHAFDFDFVYVDGDHRADAVYADCVMSLEHLVPGGLMILDDYEWRWPSLPKEQWPRVGIDRFLRDKVSEIEVLEINYQVVLRRRA